VALEERFVEGDVLDRAQALVRVEFDHAVDQQERIAVRQHPHDARDIHGHRRGGMGLGHSSGSFKGALTRRASASSWRERAALRRHARFSWTGVPEENSPGPSSERVTMLIAVMVTRSPIVMWPTSPAP